MTRSGGIDPIWQYLPSIMCVYIYTYIHICIYIYLFIYLLFPKQCLHFGVLTLAVTNWPWKWPSGRRQGYLYRYLYGNNAKKHQFYMVFYNLSSKNKGKLTVFQPFQQNIAKSTGFIRLFAIWAQKTNENQRFSTCSAKYCKKHRFYKVFEHSGCKNRGNPMVFQYFSKITQKTRVL